MREVLARLAIRTWSQRAAGCVVVVTRLDPTRAIGTVDTLPERRVGFQVVHQELGGFETRPGDVFEAVTTSTMFSPGVRRPTRCTTRIPVNRPARHRGLGVPRDLGLRHTGIVLERQRRDISAVPRCRGKRR